MQRCASASRGVDPYGPVVAGDGLLVPAQVVQRGPHVPVNKGVLGIQLQHPPKAGQGLLVAVHAAQRHPHAAVRGHVPGIQLDGPLKAAQGLLVAVHLQHGHPPVVVYLGLGGIQLRGLCKTLGRLGEPAHLVEPYPALEVEGGASGVWRLGRPPLRDSGLSSPVLVLRPPPAPPARHLTPAGRGRDISVRKACLGITCAGIPHYHGDCLSHGNLRYDYVDGAGAQSAQDSFEVAPASELPQG